MTSYLIFLFFYQIIPSLICLQKLKGYFIYALFVSFFSWEVLNIGDTKQIFLELGFPVSRTLFESICTGDFLVDYLACKYSINITPFFCFFYFILLQTTYKILTNSIKNNLGTFFLGCAACSPAVFFIVRGQLVQFIACVLALQFFFSYKTVFKIILFTSSFFLTGPYFLCNYLLVKITKIRTKISCLLFLFLAAITFEFFLKIKNDYWFDDEKNLITQKLLSYLQNDDLLTVNEKLTYTILTNRIHVKVPYFFAFGAFVLSLFSNKKIGFQQKSAIQIILIVLAVPVAFINQSLSRLVIMPIYLLFLFSSRLITQQKNSFSQIVSLLFFIFSQIYWLLTFEMESF